METHHAVYLSLHVCALFVRYVDRSVHGQSVCQNTNSSISKKNLMTNLG